MLTRTFTALAAISIIGSGLIAQERPAQSPTPASTRRGTMPAPQQRGEQSPKPPQAARPERPPEPPGQPVNIKLEITITDQVGPGEPSRKVVTMLLADKATGSIRSSGTQRIPSEGNFPVSINVDATPTILRDGSIKLLLGLEYQPRPNTNKDDQPLTISRMSQLNERLGIIVQDGKPLVISQAADPGTDRRITVELKASVLK